MKGLAGHQTRGLPVGARLHCADNTGAKVVEIIAVLKYKGVHRRLPSAGVGDLVTTCCSPHSRNRRVGVAIGRGQTLDEALEGMTMVAEGVRTSRAAHGLAGEVGVETPVVDRVHAVLFEGESPREAIRILMTREPKAEGESRSQ